MFNSFYYRGRWAMASAFKSINLKKGDKVAFQAYTCVAVPQGIIALGMSPIVIDTDINSLFMSPSLLEKAINENEIKCVIIQHTFGFVAPKAIYEVCNKYNISVIDDCAHLFPGFNEFLSIDYLSPIKFYSMEWGKSIPVGLGGYLESEVPIKFKATKNLDLLKLIKIEIQFLGFLMFYRPFFYFKLKKLFSLLSKYRLIEGNSLNLFDETELRNESFLKISPFVRKRYLKNLNKKEKTLSKDFKSLNEVLRNIELELPSKNLILDLSKSIPLRFPVWVDNKKKVLKEASLYKIPLGDWYDTPIDPLSVEFIDEVGWSKSNLFNSKNLSNHIVTIPLNKYNENEEIIRAIKFLKKFAI